MERVQQADEDAQEGWTRNNEVLRGTEEILGLTEEARGRWEGMYAR